MIQVEVAYANPERQLILALNVPVGTTVETAIERSGILEIFPEIDLSRQKIGIFSKMVSLNDQIRAGNRIEIYRPLLIDPKIARRQRAERIKAE